jgi:serine/threonine-protein kinase PknK
MPVQPLRPYRLPMSDGPEHSGTGEIPGYWIKRPVGRGGFSVVYRAQSAGLGREVAVKVLSVENPDQATMRRFQQECQLAGKLAGHPNVAAVLDTGLTRSGWPYLTMELFEAGSLRDRLGRSGALPAAEVLRAGVKIAGALAASHAVGIVHGDVKPHNILVSLFGEPVLADFGLARLLASDTSSSTGALTLAYAAPELLNGQAPVAVSDVYSLGATLYHLLAGRVPFPENDDAGIQAQLQQILNSQPAPLGGPEVPPGLEAAIRRAMAKDPAQRFADAPAFAAALQTVEQDLGVPVTEAVYRPAAPTARAAAAVEQAPGRTGPVPAGPDRTGGQRAVPLLVGPEGDEPAWAGQQSDPAAGRLSEMPWDSGTTVRLRPAASRMPEMPGGSEPWLLPSPARARSRRSAHRGRRRGVVAACATAAVVIVGLGAALTVRAQASGHHAPPVSGQSSPPSVTAGQAIPGRPRSARTAGSPPATLPGAPQNFQAAGFNHGASLSWAAAAMATGQPVSYSLAWSGGTRSGITGTSAMVTGLVNGRQYTFTLTASDAGGSGQPATATVDLIPPPHAYQVFRNDDAMLLVDSLPAPAGSAGSSVVGTVARGQSPAVTVQCQVQGAVATDPFDEASGDIWDRVSWNGQTAYISDMYVNTASSQARNFNAFTDPPLWQCS